MHFPKKFPIRNVELPKTHPTEPWPVKSRWKPSADALRQGFRDRVKGCPIVNENLAFLSEAIVKIRRYLPSNWGSVRTLRQGETGHGPPDSSLLV